MTYKTYKDLLIDEIKDFLEETDDVSLVHLIHTILRKSAKGKGDTENE